MAIKILMPALSPTMKCGKIAKWNIPEGSKINIGDVLMEIETDKAVMEFESIEEGIMGPHLVKEGQEMQVGDHIGWILESADEEIPTSEDAPVPNVSEPEPEIQPEYNSVSQDVKSVKESSDNTYLKAKGQNAFSTPAARARAKQLGISIEDIIAKLPHKVRDADVLNYKPTQQHQQQKIHQTCALSGMQKVIANRMLEAKTTVPHFYLQMTADVDNMLKIQKECRDRDIKMTLTHGLIKCIAHAMKVVPEMNVSWVDGDIVHHPSIDIAIAVSLDNDGLITPILRNADTLSLTEIFYGMQDLVDRARSNKLLPHEFQGGSTTISTLGTYGIESFYPIMNLPQASIIGVGSIRDEVVLKDDALQTKKVCSITISVDHRVVNGATAARFMQNLKSFVEDPNLLLI